MGDAANADISRNQRQLQSRGKFSLICFVQSHAHTGRMKQETLVKSHT